MRRGHLLIGLSCVAGAAASFAIGFASKAEVSDATTARLTDIAATDAHDSFAAPGSALVSGERSDARVAVPVSQSTGMTEDPCASVVGELEASRESLIEAALTIEKLNTTLARVIRERDRFKFPMNTPYGAFLAGYEANEITDPYVLAGIESWLRQFPVILQPGEATWIAERIAAKDWGQYGRTPEVALILFLGPDRLIAELPPARIAELRTYYYDEQFFD